MALGDAAPATTFAVWSAGVGTPCSRGFSESRARQDDGAASDRNTDLRRVNVWCSADLVDDGRAQDRVGFEGTRGHEYTITAHRLIA
jgi:hypothetical protein